MRWVNELALWWLWWLVAMHPREVMDALREFSQYAMWIVDSVWEAIEPYAWSAAPLLEPLAWMLAWWRLTQLALDHFWVTNEILRPLLIWWWWITTILSWLAPYMVWLMAAWYWAKYWYRYSAEALKKLWHWVTSAWKWLWRLLNPFTRFWSTPATP